MEFERHLEHLDHGRDHADERDQAQKRQVDIADQLSKRKFSFAIYDASGYKGEAVATSFHAEDNAITCTITLPKGEIKVGDKAATKTP